MTTHEIKVQIGNYFPKRGDSMLKAFFSVAVEPHGLKILDVKMFEKDDKRWLQFPAKKIEGKDGEKDQYIPYISWADKAYFALLQEAILKALDAFEQPKAITYAQSPAHSPKTAFVPLDSSALPF